MKLSQIAKVAAGNVAPKAKDFTQDGTPFVRAGSLAGLLRGESLDCLEKLDAQAAARLKMKLFPAGTVVFAKSGMSCLKGYVYTLPKDCYVVSHLACVTPKGNYSTYLQYYFRANKPNRLIENPSFPSIRLSEISDIEIALPDDAELEKTVSVLDMVEGQIALRKKEIELLDKLVKSRFVEMFGDPNEGEYRYSPKPIESICTAFVGGGTPSMKHPEYYGGTIPFIKSGDVKAKVITEGALTLTEEGLVNSSAKLIPKDSIVIVARSGILKHTLPIAIAGCPVAINQDLKAITLQEGFLAQYVQWALLVSAPLILSKVRATTADNIETKLLKQFAIPVPPLELQQEFADFVAQVDKPRFACMFTNRSSCAMRLASLRVEKDPPKRALVDYSGS